MESDYQYVIKIGRFFIGKECESGKLFVGRINKNCSYSRIWG